MGCGSSIRANEKIVETKKKAEKIGTVAEKELIERPVYDKDIEKEGILQSNRKGKPIIAQKEKIKKHWIFSVEESLSTESFYIKPWPGALRVPEYFKGINYGIEKSLFDVSFVYGYECVESRNNLFYAKDENFIVFPAGIFGIVYGVNTNQQLIYKEHNDEIVALCVHNRTSTVATGDKRFLICVWNSENLTTYKKHKSQVKGTLSLSFCPNSELLAVLGGNFKMTIYKWSNFSPVFSVEFESTVFFLATHPQIMLTCVVGKKYVGFVNSSGIVENGKFDNKGKICTMVCADWLDSICLTGATNGQIYKWTPPALESAFQVFELGVTIHALKVNQNKIFCSGADRTLVILSVEMEFLNTVNLPAYAKSIDFYAEKVLLGLNNGTIVKVDEDVECVFSGFNEEIVGITMITESIALFSVCSEIRVVDFYKKKILTRISFKSLFDSFYHLEDQVEISVKAVDYNSILSHIAISVGNGFLTIYKYQNNIRNIKSLKVANQSLNVTKFSPAGIYLACISISSIFILETSNYSVIRTIDYENNINSIDWDLEDSCFQTSSHNFELKFWNIEGEELFELNNKLASWTSKIGWPLRDLNKEFIDLSHVVSVQGSQELNYMAFGDDWGFVHIVETLAPNVKSLKCQASHVKCLNWNWKNDFLFSGGNRCIVQSKFTNIH